VTSTTHQVDTFFEKTAGTGAPSASLSKVDDFVYGEIVDQAIVDKKKFGSDEIEKDSRTGENVKQLLVVLKTDLRNWQGVSKIPTNEDKTEKAASEDDGRRAVYVAPWSNIHSAVAEAVVAATGAKGPLLNGGKLGVKITELKDTGKGNPLKIHAATYTAPAASAGFFNETAAPAASQPAPAAPAAQQDPWASTPPAAGKPPF
jgi:hypothetical protein